VAWLFFQFVRSQMNMASEQKPLGLPEPSSLGHGEQGTIEYNRALGQRWAVSAKQYLTNL
jgi:hypothetical protein